MSWIGRIMRRILPEDPIVRCGYGPLSLDPSDPLTPACALHDYDYGEAHEGKNEHTIDETDFLLFHRWSLIASAGTTPEEQCRRALQICECWPLARLGGKVLWDGNDLATVQIVSVKPDLSKP